MTQISKHISFKEATYSATAEKMEIVNDNPNLAVIENMKLVANKVFEPVRNHFGKPIKVSSFFRGMPLNQAIKGSITSQHCAGQAIDIDNNNGTPSNKEIFDYIKKNLEFDQLIWEFGTDKNPDWVHVSFIDGKNRKQVLRAKKINGQTSYETI